MLTEPQLRHLFAFKPRRMREWRAYTLDCLLVDTGLRIEEALQLTPADVDMDNLLLKVKGKGRKERLVPFSVTLRQLLVRWRNRVDRKGWPANWVFPTSRGTRLTQRNCLRAHYDLLKQSSIPKCGFHRLRHTFATSYLKTGGDVGAPEPNTRPCECHHHDEIRASGNGGFAEAPSAVVDSQPTTLIPRRGGYTGPIKRPNDRATPRDQGGPGLWGI